MSREFQQPLFGCFKDLRSCVITYFVPCYTEGKIAEKVNESCLLHTFLTLIPIVNLVCIYIIRSKVMTQKGIPESAAKDILTVICCPTCALCQEAVEVDAFGATMARE